MNTFFLNVAGIDPLGDGTVSALDDPRITSFVQDMRDLIDAGYCSYVGASVNNAQDDMMAAFSLGEIAAYTDTSSGIGSIIKKVDFEVGTAVGVSGTSADPVSTVSGACLVIYADHDQNTKNAAFQWATYLTNAENSSAWSVQTCMFPVRKSCDISAMYEKYPGAEGVFENADKIVGKNKSPAMQSAMETVAGVVGEYVKGNVAKSDFDSTWANLKKEVDGILADAA
jgi:ABC-type glycerol-3-phosphate transport system substrate-binding protein